MSASTSRLAYDDCYKLLNQALESPKGIRARFSERGDAYHLRTRLQNARAIDRKDNFVTYNDPGHMLHGRSIYDSLRILIRHIEDHFYVVLEKLDAREFVVEELEDGIDQPASSNHGEAEREIPPAPTLGSRRI